MIYKHIKQQVIASLITLFLPFLIMAACVDVSSLPAEVLAFVPSDLKVIDYAVGDLDDDGRNDAILVLQKPEPVDLSLGLPQGQRPLLVLRRQADGKLKLAVRSENAVKCEQCGGTFGDPFEGLVVHRKGFIILHYGGSAWRWRQDFTFAFSRRDQTWQLVAADTLNYYSCDSNEEMKENHYTSPRDFGLINLADFEVNNWKNRGKR